MRFLLAVIFGVLIMTGCSKHSGSDPDPVTPPTDTVKPKDTSFIFGADISYANQLMDLDAVFKDNGVASDPYKILKAHGSNLVRLRLWHNPTWTKEVYGAAGKKMYSDIADVEQAISLAKRLGLKVLLDFHYSDTWADPGKQEVPAAWKNIKDINVLKDSIYQYTLHTLQYLNGKGLLPDMVQAGNETNCGLLYSNAAADFPPCNVCNGNWANAGAIINSAVKAVREVSTKTRIILHVGDPKNVQWWFDNIKLSGGVSDFDIIGISYYPIWHTTVAVSQLASNIAAFKSRFNKDVMIVETAYPWTDADNDTYKNLFGTGSAIAGYPFSQQSQYDIMKDISQAVITGGGKGVICWEPDWISVPAMKDLWGTGSCFENCAFFDNSGNTVKAIDYPTYNYKW